MNMKQFIKKNPVTQKERTSFHGKFIDRKKNREKRCMVLAGYKEFSYPAVLGRLKKFLDEDIDVCIITSGKWSDVINEICENKWLVIFEH